MNYQHEALTTEIRDYDLPAYRAILEIRLLHGVLTAVTESGELADQVKKHLYYGKPLDKVNILEEAGDILWGGALVLEAAGLTLEEAMERNVAKLKTRYPEKFEAAKAIERDLDAERRTLEE